MPKAPQLNQKTQNYSQQPKFDETMLPKEELQTQQPQQEQTNLTTNVCADLPSKDDNLQYQNDNNNEDEANNDNNNDIVKSANALNETNSIMAIDNQNGNESCELEGTGIVKTQQQAGKVVKRKKTPPQGGNGNNVMSTSLNNANTTATSNNINNNRANNRASVAKMEGILNTSSSSIMECDNSIMSTSMEMEGMFKR